MTNNQRETKDWILQIARHMNMSVSQLALNSGIAASTLTRYLNDMSGNVSITQSSLEKVAAYSGFRPSQFPGRARPGEARLDAIPVDQDPEPRPQWLNAAIASAKGNNIEAWIMKGGALDGIGVLPGDIILIDKTRRAKPGDIVLIQVNQHIGGTPETVMRLYQPPFIISFSLRMGPSRPEQVDEDRVSIIGACVGVLRAR